MFRIENNNHIAKLKTAFLIFWKRKESFFDILEKFALAEFQNFQITLGITVTDDFNNFVLGKFQNSKLKIQLQNCGCIKYKCIKLTLLR